MTTTMERTRQHKSFKAAATVTEEGKVIARIARLDEVDHDGDITRAGAFGDDLRVAMHVQHDGYQNLPVGKGRIYEDGKDVIFEGQYNLDIQAGRDAFSSVKFQGELQEWSYGYFVTDASPGDGKSFLRELKAMEVYEVSQVTIGAGKATGTLDVKNREQTMDLIKHLAEEGDTHAADFLAIIDAEAEEAEGMKFAEEINAATRRVEGLTKRATEIRNLRSEQGRSMGTAAVESLKAAHQSLSSLLDELETARAADDEPETVDMTEQYAAFQATMARMNGVNI